MWLYMPEVLWAEKKCLFHLGIPDCLCVEEIGITNNYKKKKQKQNRTTWALKRNLTLIKRQNAREPYKRYVLDEAQHEMCNYIYGSFFIANI